MVSLYYDTFKLRYLITGDINAINSMEALYGLYKLGCDEYCFSLGIIPE